MEAKPIWEEIKAIFKAIAYQKGKLQNLLKFKIKNVPKVYFDQSI